MTVAELIEALKDEPQDWRVAVEPVYPNACGLAAGDQVPGRITGLGHSKRDRHPDGGLYDAEGKLAPGGTVSLSVFTPWEG